jgi:nitrogen fixation protein NifX
MYYRADQYNIIQIVRKVMNELAEVKSVADVIDDGNLLIVAFATSDGECVNQHFGSSRGFHVFGISGDNADLLATSSYAKEKKDGNEDKLKPKLAWLHGCDLVYCGSVGGSATKQLITLGAHPIVVKGGPDIKEIIEELQDELNGSLSPMLDRVMRQKISKSDNRFDEMENEGWDE